MRWLKIYRGDLESPAFQAGIERFGSAFVHDLLAVWSSLMAPDGPGLRELPLTDDSLSWLAKRMRRTPDEAREVLEFAREWRLIELRKRKVGARAGSHRAAAGLRRAQSGLQLVCSSRELLRRRDEWSRRKERKEGGLSAEKAQEPLRSYSGGSPATESEVRGQIQNQTQTAEPKSERMADTARLSGKIENRDFKDLTDLFRKTTGGRFDCEVGFDGYEHRGSFILAIQEAVKDYGSLPANTEERAELMGIVLDVCADKGFRAPLGWVRVLSDLRRELKSGEGARNL